MAALPIPEVVAWRFQPYVEELHEFFVTYGQPFGSPEDILPLTERLHTPAPFQDDLSSLVRSIILREGGSLPHAQLLEILAVAISGKEIGNVPQDYQKPLRELLAFVTQVVHRPWNLPPGSDLNRPVQTEGFVEKRDSPVGSGMAAALATAIGNQNSPPILFSPRGEASTAGETSPPEFNSDDPGAEPSHYSKRRLAWITAACAVPFALLLALPNRSGSVIQTEDGGSTSPLVGGASVIAGPSGAGALALAKPTAYGPTQVHPQPPALPSPAPARPAPSLPPVSPAIGESPTRRGAAYPPSDAQSETVPRALSPRVSAASGRVESESIHSDDRIPTRPVSTSYGRAVAGRKISSFEVSSGVMAANLVSAPEPHYPVLAKLAHIEGEVILQAVIAKDGRVSATHVLSGHRLLRGSAVSAVQHWRYRPYIVDGHPVNVATIVTVDFKTGP